MIFESVQGHECVPNMKSIEKIFLIYRVNALNGAFLMNVARKSIKHLLKIEFYDYRKTWDLR